MVGCGNYGPSGSQFDFDFVHIPMASADGTATLTQATSNFCGGGLVTAISNSAVTGTGTSAMPANQITICSKYKKYNVITQIHQLSSPWRLRALDVSLYVHG